MRTKLPFLKIVTLALSLNLLCTGALQAGVQEARLAWKAGVQAEKAQKWRTALRAYRQVLQHSPNYSRAWRQLAVCHYRLKDYRASLRALDKYLARKPGDAAMQKWAGQLRASLRVPEKSPPVRPKVSWGLRAAGSFALALSKQTVNVDGKGQPIELTPGGGPGFSGEILYAFHPHWEAGLGVYPRFFNDEFQSSVTDGFSVDTRDEARFSSFPIVMTLYARQPLAPAWHWLGGAGLGFSPGGTMELHSETSSTFGTGLTRTQRLVESKLRGGLALRAMTGFEVSLTRIISFTFGGEYLWTSLVAEEERILIESFDATGASLAPPIDITSNTGNKLEISTLSAFAALTLRF